jgi:hypothetical protein
MKSSISVVYLANDRLIFLCASDLESFKRNSMVLNVHRATLYVVIARMTWQTGRLTYAHTTKEYVPTSTPNARNPRAVHFNLVIIVALSATILVNSRDAIYLHKIFLLTRSIRAERRPLRLATNSHAVSAMWREAIRCRMVLKMVRMFISQKDMLTTHSDPVIPKCDIVLGPLEPDVRFLGCGNDIAQVLDDSVALQLWDANDLGHEARVEE